MLLKIFMLSLGVGVGSFQPAWGQTTLYRCAGANISGTIQVKDIGAIEGSEYSKNFPRFESIANLKLAGVGTYSIESGNYVTYFKRVIPFGDGAWEYDRSRVIYNLGGAELKLNSWPDVLRLEVSQTYLGTRKVRGYLGHRDADSNRGTKDDTRFDFKCEVAR